MRKTGSAADQQVESQPQEEQGISKAAARDDRELTAEDRREIVDGER